MADTTVPRGVMGACLTPFGADGAPDLDRLPALVDHLVADVDVISIGAVEAAEYTTLRPDDRAALLRSGIAAVDGRVPVVAGASGGSVAGSLRWIELAAEAGTDLAQVLMPTNPWGGEPTADELVDYFERIATASPLPLVVYHNPATGADPAISTYVAISELDCVVAFKESSRNVSKIARLIQEVDAAGNAAYFTTMQPLLITLILGGAGATMPPPGTRIAARVRDAFAAGDLELATRWQQLFSFFPGVWATYGLAPVMKAALAHVGVPIGGPVAPFAALPPDVDASLRRFVEGSGMLGDEPASSDELRALIHAG